MTEDNSVYLKALFYEYYLARIMSIVLHGSVVGGSNSRVGNLSHLLLGAAHLPAGVNLRPVQSTE